MKSLVEQAKALGHKERKTQPAGREGAALALAWAKGEIAYVQAQAVLTRSRGASVYTALALGLRDALRLGMLREVKERKAGKA